MKTMRNLINAIMMLQLFAANMNTTATETLTTENAHTYWETALIYLAGPKLIHDQCAQLTKIPEGNSKTVEFNVVQDLSTDIDSNTLAEGVPGDGQQLTITPITVEVAQYGNYVEISDMLQLTAKHGMFKVATNKLSSQAAGVGDKITRNKMHECTTSFVAGGVASLSKITADTYLTVDDIFKAAARLKGKDTPTFGDGCYRAIAHPYVTKDLMSNAKETTAWMDIKKYANPEDILNGEVGKVGQVRVLETTNAKYYKAGDEAISDAASGVTVFATIVLGDDAVGTTELSGMGLSMIIKSAAEIGGPLEQYGTAGWKMTKAAEILCDDYITKIYSSASEANLITASN